MTRRRPSVGHHGTMPFMHESERRRSRVVLVAWLAWLSLAGGRPPTGAVQQATSESLAGLVAELSEPGGYFDTDNLISNERSYLMAMPGLEAAGLSGGAYVGVGPDQNFAYIATLRPDVAFIVDIRRDNLLLHLLFKALFELSPSRLDYLAWLIGRLVPPADSARDLTIDALVQHIETSPRAGDDEIVARQRAIDRALASVGVPLSNQDLATIRRFHTRFMNEGLDLRFNTTGRAPQRDYPTYRQLLIERQPDGTPGSFLASDGRYQVVRRLEQADRVIPVVGDLAGAHALVAIGDWLRQHGTRLSAFYASNVEFYLFRSGTFGAFVGNLQTLPLAPNAVLIRSVFGNAGRVQPLGYGSVSLTQPIAMLLDGFEAGRYRAYWELTGRD